MFSRPSVTALLVTLVATFATLGLASALPAWLGPDEGPHLQYAGWLATHRALPDPSVDDVFQSQHPPAYHAVLGIVRPALTEIARALPEAWRRPGALPLPAHIDLESDRKVPDPGALPSLSPTVLAKTDLSKIPGADGFELRVWRAFGVVFLLATCASLFASTKSLPGIDRTLAAYAAAVGVLAPAFVAAFATPNNDQWAACFAATGFLVALRAGGRPRDEWICGTLFAIGVAGKLTVIGATTAGAVYAALGHVGARARAASAARVALPAFAVAAAWMLRQSVLGGGPDGVSAASTLHAAILRDRAPDGLGVLDTVGRWMTSWIGETGGDGIGPGAFAVALGAAVPVVCAGGSFWIALRGPTGAARRACLAFVAGAAVLGIALSLGNRHYYWTNGRYFIVLAAPAAVAFANVLDVFLGARARGAAAVSACVMGLATTLLLFGHVLPTYHPPRSRVAAPHLVAYVDAGSHLDRDATVKGSPRRYPDAGVPGPGSNAVFDPTEATIRVTDLPKDRPLLARVVPAVEPRPDVGVVDVLVDGWPVTGAFSPEVVRDGIDVVVPTWASADGTILVSLRSKVGAGAGIAEVSVFAAAIGPSEIRRDGTDILVSMKHDGDGVVLPYVATLKKGDITYRSAEGTSAAPKGMLRFPGATDADTLVVEPSSMRMCDFKVARFASQDAEVRGDVRSLGFDVVRLPSGAAPGTTLMPLFGSLFPEGGWTLALVDALESPIPRGMVDLVTADGRRLPADGATIRVDAASQAGRCGDLVVGNPSRVGIDRIVVRGARAWTWPIPAP